MRSTTWFVPVTSASVARFGRRVRILIGFGLLSCVLATPAAAQDQPEEEQQEQLPQVQAPEPENIENLFSFGYINWRPDQGRAGYFGGAPSLNPPIQHMVLPPAPARGNGFELTVPTGGNNRLEIGYWKLTDSGQYRPQSNKEIYGANISAGEGVNEQYALADVRIAWNYLTFPVPPLDSRFRIKTFWEFHYITAKTVLAFPDRANATGAIPQVSPKEGNKLPGLGIGFEYVYNRKFRIESRLSGGGWPGHSHYADLQVNAVARFANFVEILGGVKGFHFRTSPQNAQFIRGTLFGPFFGLRFVLN